MQIRTSRKHTFSQVAVVFGEATRARTSKTLLEALPYVILVAVWTVLMYLMPAS